MSALSAVVETANFIGRSPIRRLSLLTALGLEEGGHFCVFLLVWREDDPRIVLEEVCGILGECPQGNTNEYFA